MCVAFPMKIVSVIDDTHCIVSASGVERKDNTRLLPGCSEGDYVLVHAGFAMQKVEEKDAQETYALMAEMRGAPRTVDKL